MQIYAVRVFFAEKQKILNIFHYLKRARRGLLCLPVLKEWNVEYRPTPWISRKSCSTFFQAERVPVFVLGRLEILPDTIHILLMCHSLRSQPRFPLCPQLENHTHENQIRIIRRPAHRNFYIILPCNSQPPALFIPVFWCAANSAAIISFSYHLPQYICHFLKNLRSFIRTLRTQVFIIHFHRFTFPSEGRCSIGAD